MRIKLLGLTALLCTTAAFGQEKLKTTTSIMLNFKPTPNSLHIYIDNGSHIDLGKKIGDYWEVTFREKLRYMRQDLRQYCIPIDSVMPPPRSILNLPIDPETKKITFTEVVIVDSTTTKDQLFERAQDWFVKAYGSGKEVIQLADKELGKIIGKALIPFGKDMGYIYYTISIYVKDGKYKYVLTDFYHKSCWFVDAMYNYGPCENCFDPNPDVVISRSFDKLFYDGARLHIISSTATLIPNLKAAMKAKSVLQDKDDW